MRRFDAAISPRFIDDFRRRRRLRFDISR